jgi:hypothetical protein
MHTAKAPAASQQPHHSRPKQHPLAREHDLNARVGHAREVTARPVQGGDESKRDWIEADLEHDRNGRGRRLCRKRRRSGSGGNQAYLTLNQIGRQCRQPLVSIAGEAVFDRNVLTLDKTAVSETLAEGGQKLRGVAGPTGGEEPDHRHRRLLRTRRKRPRRCRTTEQRDELAAAV